MAFPKGHKLSGSRKGSKNKKTEQWEAFAEYCMSGGLQKLEKELNKLEGKEFALAFTNLMEFHKPKLARTEVTGLDGGPIKTVSETTVFSLKTKGK